MYNGDATKKSSVGILGRIFHRRKKRLLTNVELEFLKCLDAFTLYSIIFIILGVVFAVWGNVAEVFFKVSSGCMLLVYAFVSFYFFFRRRELSYYNFSILYGIIAFLLGAFVFFQGNIQDILKIFGGFYLLVSLSHYLEAFYFIRLHDNDVLVLLVSNVLIDFIAVLLFINPFSQLSGGEVMGVFMILFGIVNISILSFLSKKTSSFLSFFES